MNKAQGYYTHNLMEVTECLKTNPIKNGFKIK